MKKALKNFLIFILGLLFVVYLLFRYLSAGNLKENEYATMVDYDRDSSSGDSTFSVMTYNIGYLSGMINNQSVRRELVFFDNNLQQAKKLIQEMDADLIGFQEIDFGAARSFYINQLDSLAKVGKYAATYRSINWDKKYVPFPYWPPSNHFGEMLSGQALLSKFKLGNGETTKLAPYSNAPFYYRAFYLDRLLQTVKVAIEGVEVLVMNVHLEAYDTSTRLEQIKEVLQVYEQYASLQPVILMGDFNSEIPEKAESKDAIELLMEAPWIASAISFDQEHMGKTYPSNDPERMIDYIFYNQNFLKCRQAKVVLRAGEISDHLPIWAEFEVK